MAEYVAKSVAESLDLKLIERTCPACSVTYGIKLIDPASGELIIEQSYECDCTDGPSRICTRTLDNSASCACPSCWP